MTMTFETCIACGNRDSTISRFKLPKDKDARERWLRNCDVLPPYEFPKSAKICALHFAEEAFSTPKNETVCRRRLRRNAEPSFRVEFAWIEESENSNEVRSTTSKWKRCFICGHLPLEEKRSMFRFPLDVERRDIWLKILGKENESVSKETRLCDIHFVESDIYKHPRAGRPMLRCGALPVITCNAAVEIETDKHEDSTVHHWEGNTNEGTAMCESAESEILQNEVPIVTSNVVARSNSPFETDCERPEVLSPTQQPALYTGSIAPSNEINTPTGIRYLKKKSKNNEHVYFQNVPIEKRRLFKQPRYIGDVGTPHLCTPRRAKRSFVQLKLALKKQRLMIHCLQKKVRVMKKKCKHLEDVIANLKANGYLSKNDSNHLMVRLHHADKISNNVENRMSNENKSTFAVVSELFNEMNTIKKKINAHLKKQRTKNCRIRIRIEKLKESLIKVKEEAARKDPILESLFENAIKEPDIVMETNDGNDATTSSTIRDLDVVGTKDNNDPTTSNGLQKAHVIETNDEDDPTTSSAIVEPADEITMNDGNEPATSSQSSNNDNPTISAINNIGVSSKYVDKSNNGGCFRSYLAEELKNFPPEDFESLKKDIINVLNSHNPMEKV